MSNKNLTLVDFALSSFLAIADAVCSKTVHFEPELAVVVACGSCETSVDWVTRVEFGFLVNFCYQINRAAIYGAFDVDGLIDGDFHCSDDSSFHMTCSGGPNLDKQSIGHLSLEFQNEPLGR